jgi:intracellular sulfur oxidation DsrE/DsrF family protein
MRPARLIAGALIALAPLAPAFADDAGLTIDIPVVLESPKIVLNLDHLAFEGDQPTGIQFLKVMTERFKEQGTDATIIAIFHGAAGYMALDDDAYDRVRKWSGGNPYKAEIEALMATGVAFEECGQTMHDMHWVNAELIPGIKVNAGANFRIVDLVQQGYVQIQP